MYCLILDCAIPRGELSRTAEAVSILTNALVKEGCAVSPVRLSDLYPTWEMKGRPDVWSELKYRIIRGIEECEIFVLATPIWWGNHSSLAQLLIEWMDDQDNEAIRKSGGKLDGRIQPGAPFYGKVFGSIVVGAEDGVQHICGNLYNAMSWMGFTIPPLASLTWTFQPRSHAVEMSKTMARMLVETSNKLTHQCEK
jgi:multimeric flavodoxin WrbA